MSTFDNVLTISLAEQSTLDKAAAAAMALSHATRPEDCIAVENAVLWAAESPQAFPEGQPTVETITTRAVQGKDRFKAKTQVFSHSVSTTSQHEDFVEPCEYVCGIAIDRNAASLTQVGLGNHRTVRRLF